MTTAQTRLRRWVEAGLEDNGHPDLEAVVRERRLVATPWPMLAAQVSEMSEETVSHQTLIDWFPDLNKPAYELAAELETTPPAA